MCIISYLSLRYSDPEVGILLTNSSHFFCSHITKLSERAEHRCSVLWWIYVLVLYDNTSIQGGIVETYVQYKNINYYYCSYVQEVVLWLIFFFFFFFFDVTWSLQYEVFRRPRRHRFMGSIAKSNFYSFRYYYDTMQLWKSFNACIAI